MTLSTSYLGLNLPSPLVASASPLSSKLEGVKQLAEAGAGAIVLYSLFEEQLTLTTEELSTFLSEGSHYAEALEQISESNRLRMTPLDYLRYLSAARQTVDIPIIASLNGAPHLRWTHYAKLLEQAGAAALEVNLYFVPGSIDEPGERIEHAYIETIEALANEVDIPVAVKMSPYFSNIGNVAKRLVDAGAKGLVLFNRYYDVDIDVDRRQVVPKLELSSPHDLRLPLRWTGILRDKVPADIAITGGVHTADDVVKSILVGANVAMVCSTLMQHGVGHLETLNRNLMSWMSAEDINSFDDIRGAMSQKAHDDPSVFERAQYIKTLESAS